MAVRIILYGCGNIGREALDFFGEENIACFCDSRDDLVGKTVYGKEVISRSRLEEIHGDYILLISTSINIAHEIADMLEAREIYDFLIYEMIKKDVLKELTAGEFISKYASPEKRSYLQRDYYRDKAQKLQYQLDYLKQHADITALKPATGYLRKKQMDIMRFALEFFEFIQELNIKPFLIGGNLIGAVRHNGYVPWDDDLDFGLIREDYEKLLLFCREKCFVEIYDGSWLDYTTDKHMARLDRVVCEHPNQYILDIWVDQIQITRGTSALDRKAVDFWPFDFYKEEYSIEEHNKYLAWLENRKKEIGNVPDIMSFIRNEIKHNNNISEQPTGKIHPGIDSVEGFLRYKKGRGWIDAVDLFPLKEHRFENTFFFVPNNPHRFLQYEYPDYMEFPREFGNNPHGEYMEKYFVDFWPTVEFYLVDAFEIYHFLPLYWAFEKNRIYSKFIAEPAERNTSGRWFDFDTANKILNENHVRYGFECNPEADFAFTTQEADVLRKYKKKKVHMAYGYGLTTYSFCESKKTIAGFDYKLVHGKVSYEQLLSDKGTTGIIQIGYPKYMNVYDRLHIENTDINFDVLNPERKPVLVYFPTWDDSSSILWYADEISRLRQKYFIITKAHHCTYRLETEQERLSVLDEISDVVLAGNYEFEKAANLGNIALCDAISGAATEVPFANEGIKLILLYSPIKEKNSFKPIMDRLAVSVKTPSELHNVVDHVMMKDDFLESRKELVKQIYGNKNIKELEELVCMIREDSKHET